MSARIVNVRPKPGFLIDHGGNVVPMRLSDGLTNLVTGLGTRADARMGRAYASLYLAPQQIEEAFEASPSLRKAISIPATDRVRAWRDWQADDAQIALLEAEEKRLQIQAKCKQGEILRGLGGGALVLVGAGDPAMPLNVTGKGGLVAVNVVTRWHLSGEEWDEDLASSTYGEPRFWTINGTNQRTRLHPSRVVCFRGDPLPSLWRGTQEDRFWGRGRVPSLLESAQNLDEALGTFSALIKDAMNVDIGVSKLLEIVATPDGEAKLQRRLALMIQGGSVFNGKLYDLGDEAGKGGEKLDRHQVAWTGIPEIIRAYAEAFCAAADIPFTRFWGTSAKGLNATGEGDERDWNKMVETGQELELKPCMDQIDAALIPSALGSRPDAIWWKFAPLSIPTESEETTRFKTWTDAMEKVALSGAVPEVAYNETYQNGLRENGWTPGIDVALDKIPEAERFGGAPDMADPNEDPSAIQMEGGDPTQSAGKGGARTPAARAANDARFNDATPRTLYVRRDVLPETVRALKAWAKEQGLPELQDDLHVTIAYSTTPVDWIKMGQDWRDQDGKGGMTVTEGGPRVVEPLGDRTAVLMFASSDLSWRNREMREKGASWSYEDYQPHISLTGEPIDLTGIDPFRGEIKLGAEIFEEIDEGAA